MALPSWLERCGELVGDREEAQAAQLAIGAIRLPARALALRAALYCVAVLAMAEFGWADEWLATLSLTAIAAALSWHAALPWPAAAAAALVFPAAEMTIVNAAERAWRYRLSNVHSSGVARAIGLPTYVFPWWVVSSVLMLDVYRIGARVTFLLSARLPPK